MATIGGTFIVNGGTYREIEMDTDGMTADEIAAALEDRADMPSLCHQCTEECEDPQLGEMTSLTIDGKWFRYDPATRHWQPE
jgi:hypothetical protein